jgi:Spy/CpxP family protein refolding chaperone
MWRLFVIGLLGCLVFAQGPPDKDDPREIIEKVRMYRLTQELDLTTEQAVKFFPKLNEIRKSEQKFFEERLEIIKELRELLKDSSADKELTTVIDRFKTIQDERQRVQGKTMDEIREILSPQQQARFLIFQEEFEREIREVIKEVRGHRPPPPK